jgi:hypothetical protein
VIHVYAFADELRELPPLDGIEGAQLERTTIDGLEAVVSRRSGQTTRDSLRADALVHGMVVEALVDRAAAVLPVRFAEESTDDESLAAAVRPHLEALERGLERVRGCVELGLRLVPLAPAAPATGAEYMALLRDEGGVVDRLHGDLSSMSREASLRRIGRDRVGAYLLPRVGVEAAKTVVDRFVQAHPEVTVRCTGPWAPYSFAGVPA